MFARLKPSLEIVVGLPVGWDPCCVNITQIIKSAVEDCLGSPVKVSPVSGTQTLVDRS